MAVLADLAILVLLGTALVFSIIELGVSAHVTSLGWGRGYYTGDGEGDYYYAYTIGAVPGQIAFLVFCSVWTLLVTAALIAMPYFLARKRSGNFSIRWLARLTLALNGVTMIFWLAGFAALANLYGGNTRAGVYGALLAFAVMLWLIFLALLIINILTALAVLRSDRVEYLPMFRQSGNGSAVPMSQV